MDKICLFDLDGTLTDPKEGLTKGVAHALASFDIKITNLDELTKFIGPPLTVSFREFYNFTEAEIELAVDKYREYYFETGIYENYVYPGIVEMLEQLQKSGVEILMATFKPTVSAERVAEHFKLTKYFSLIAGVNLEGGCNCKSEIIEYALSKVDPQRQKTPVMIGDRKHDIIGAKKAKINNIGVSWGYGSVAELETAGADIIVHSPKEICELIRKV